MITEDKHITKDIYLIYSPDDNGYYLEKWEPGHWYVSDIYPNQTKAMVDLKNNKINWKES